MTRSAVREGEVTIHSGLPVGLDRSTLSATLVRLSWSVSGQSVASRRRRRARDETSPSTVVRSLGQGPSSTASRRLSTTRRDGGRGADRVTFKVISKTDLDVGDTVLDCADRRAGPRLRRRSGMRLR